MSCDTDSLAEICQTTSLAGALATAIGKGGGARLSPKITFAARNVLNTNLKNGTVTNTLPRVKAASSLTKSRQTSSKTHIVFLSRSAMDDAMRTNFACA